MYKLRNYWVKTSSRGNLVKLYCKQHGEIATQEGMTLRLIDSLIRSHEVMRHK